MKFELIVSHKNCLDGHSCVAIRQGINYKLNIYSWVIYLNANEKIGTSWFLVPSLWLLSFLVSIRVVFTDITPPNICEFVKKFKNTSIFFELYDHHYTQKDNISELEKLNLPNVSITFEPELKFGATKMLIDKYKDLMTEEQVKFFTKIAACDMWNKQEFPDLVYFLFGFYNFCDLSLDGKIPKSENLWDISFEGTELIDMELREGKKFYQKAELVLNEWIEINIHKIKINYENKCKILLINIDDLPYSIKNSTSMTSVLSHYLDRNRYWDVNVLATYKNNLSDYVSLRSVSYDNDNESYDVSELAKLCDGGGHKKASGCKLDRLKVLLKVT
jgi:oligoribonuclease NrnB/cAMP/cGMP phosphodiesterase (DHH superfamily)